MTVAAAVTQPAPLENESRPESIGVGYPIWYFDVNRRVYGVDSRPIWRQYWRLVRVTGDTSRQWIVFHGAHKFPKTIRPGESLPKGLAWTEADLALLEWAHDHAYRVAQAVQMLDAPELARIARLIGYQPSP